MTILSYYHWLKMLSNCNTIILSLLSYYHNGYIYIQYIYKSHHIPIIVSMISPIYGFGHRGNIIWSLASPAAFGPPEVSSMTRLWFWGFPYDFGNLHMTTWIVYGKFLSFWDAITYYTYSRTHPTNPRLQGKPKWLDIRFQSAGSLASFAMETEERHVASLVTCTSACACHWHVNVLAKELRRLLQKDLLWQCEHAVLQRDLHLREFLVRCFSCLPFCINLSGKTIYFLLERQISAHIAHIILDHRSTIVLLMISQKISQNLQKIAHDIP
jgi:hypothetical protein